MPLIIRDVQEHELDSILAINNAAGPSILPMDSTKARFFWDNAEYFRVAEHDGQITGFLIAVSHEVAHDSPNFLWFRQRYPQFMYIDRIVIARPRRGGGRGRAFYADVMSFAELRWPLLCCEVFLEAGNNPAMLFHAGFGFREAGQQVMAGTQLRASMLTKQMCSYPWVRDHYSEGLPDLPWLQGRLTTNRAQKRATAS